MFLRCLLTSLVISNMETWPRPKIGRRFSSNFAPNLVPCHLKLSGLKVSGNMLAEYIKQIPAGRLGQPADVAHAVLFLACEESSYISGQTLPITGGWI